MTKKQLTSIKSRIRKANAGFGVMGSVMLSMEFQGMSADDKAALIIECMDNSGRKKPVCLKSWAKELDLV